MCKHTKEVSNIQILHLDELQKMKDEAENKDKEHSEYIDFIKA